MILLLEAAGVCWALEQPASTLLHLHPRFQAMLRDGRVRAFQHFFYMGAYGSPTPKPSYIFTSESWLVKLGLKGVNATTCTGERLAKTYIDDAGQKRCTGTAHLRASQSYPLGFGQAFAELWKNRTIPVLDFDNSEADVPRFKDSWEDARLEEVVDFFETIRDLP